MPQPSTDLTADDWRAVLISIERNRSATLSKLDHHSRAQYRFLNPDIREAMEEEYLKLGALLERVTPLYHQAAGLELESQA